MGKADIASMAGTAVKVSAVVEACRTDRSTVRKMDALEIQLVNENNYNRITYNNLYETLPVKKTAETMLVKFDVLCYDILSSDFKGNTSLYYKTLIVNDLEKF
ncbi:hypothetical protein MCHI_001296 [Candidatus Magnetoovum chiemensis]|nr:hypothetical protein MCHI_001296 [Candidatus Magnetoovum chiemensis]